MIRFWAAAKSWKIPVKAGVLEAICLEQTWPLSLISELSASVFPISARAGTAYVSLPRLSVILSPALISIVRAHFLCAIFRLFFNCHSSFSHSSSPCPSRPPSLPLSLSIFPALSFSLQTAREKESSQAQLKALSQQTEVARRELAEILGRLAQREEELHRKDVELSESRQRHLSLEQEIREVWGRAPRNGKYICFKTQGTQECLSNS